MFVKSVHFYIIELQRPIGGLVFWGVEHDIEHCHFVSYFLPKLQLNIGKIYLKTAIIIDESLILAIVSHNYSTKPSYIFQLKRDLKVWKYIYLTYSTSKCLSKTGIRSSDLCLCLFWLFMNIRPVLYLVFGWIINCPCLSFFFFWC